MTAKRPGSDINWIALHGDFFRNVRVLVTGGAGFIGSHLTEALTTLGARVVVLDDLIGGSTDNLKGMDAVDFVHGSILDQSLVEKTLAGCRFVFHQAALGSVPASIERPRSYVEVNVTGTLNILEAARLSGVERIMFAASSSAYGESPTLPKSETMPPSPLSPYAASKVAAEALMSAYAHSYGLDTVSLRYFNIFGPRQNANSAYAAVIAAFAKSLLQGQPPVIFGDGEQSRDFTYVANAVHANLLAARCADRLNGIPLNVACGEQVTINELALKMAAALGRPNLKPLYKPARTGDVKHSLADLRQVRAAIGFAPLLDWSAGLEITMNGYREAALEINPTV